MNYDLSTSQGLDGEKLKEEEQSKGEAHNEEEARIMTEQDAQDIFSLVAIIISLHV